VVGVRDNQSRDEAAQNQKTKERQMRTALIIVLWVWALLPMALVFMQAAGVI